MKILIMFTLLISSLSAREIIVETRDASSVQSYLNNGYTVKAVSGCLSDGDITAVRTWVFVLVEPSAEEMARMETERQSKIKADFEKRRAEYLKALPKPEKESASK